jgi:CO/xanthine dehydrogenase Mo-binding subunit
MLHRGKGTACMYYPIGATFGAMPSLAYVNILMDGSSIVYTGATDIGQGSDTALKQIAAEALCSGMECITLVTADSMYTGFDMGPVASRQTYITGNAIKLACEDAVKKLLDAAGIMLGIPAEALFADDNMVRIRDYAGKAIPFSAVSGYSTMVLGKPIHGSAAYNPPVSRRQDEKGGGRAVATHAYAAQTAVVDVDDETGEFEVITVYAVHDCGKAINPMLAKGQITGGIGMGIGFARYEEIVRRNGRAINAGFTDYILPTAADMPQIECELLEISDETGPYGAKGIAEPAIVPTAPAIANAIYDAVGVMICDLPITPEKIIEKLKKRSKTT